MARTYFDGVSEEWSDPKSLMNSSSGWASSRRSTAMSTLYEEPSAAWVIGVTSLQQTKVGLVYVIVMIEISVRTIQQRSSQVRARLAGIKQAKISVIHGAVAVQVSRQGWPFQTLVRSHVHRGASDSHCTVDVDRQRLSGVDRLGALSTRSSRFSIHFLYVPNQVHIRLTASKRVQPGSRCRDLAAIGVCWPCPSTPFSCSGALQMRSPVISFLPD